MHSPVTGASSKHSSTKECQLSAGIGVDGGGGGGEGGEGGGEGAIQVLSIVSHELAGVGGAARVLCSETQSRRKHASLR